MLQQKISIGSFSNNIYHTLYILWLKTYHESILDKILFTDIRYCLCHTEGT